MLTLVATALAGAAVGAGGLALRRRRAQADALEQIARQARLDRGRVEADRDAAIAQTRARAESRRARLREDLDRARGDLEAAIGRIGILDGAAALRAEAIDERDQAQETRQTQIKARQREVSALEKALRTTEREIDATVERQSGRTRDRIIEELGQSLSEEAAMAARRAARALEERAEATREGLATRVMEAACQRYGAGLTAPRLVTHVPLPAAGAPRAALLGGDRAALAALTAATGVEFVEQEESLHLRAADPYTREVGRLALEGLLAGRIDPDEATRHAAQAAKALERTVREAGQRAAQILRLKGMHPEILHLVGKLLYRTSYTQNQWTHAIETAHLCALMARDLKLDVVLARRSALIHDIGKVLYEETERVGSHAVSGAAFARAHGETDVIVHPVAAHHNDEAPATALAHLVAAADALSGARPGARRETEEAFGSRVEDFERICADYQEIDAAFVIQGGREVRVVVDPRRLDDLGAVELSMEIAGRIESEVTYPGQVKVTVMREIRASAVARRR